MRRALLFALPIAVACVDAEVGADDPVVYDTAAQPTAPPAGPPLIALDVETDYACTLSSEGEIACTGDAPAAQQTPTQVGFRRIATGESAACALDADGYAECWGDIGPPPEVAFAELSMGRRHACGLTSEGWLHCWGDDFDSPISELPAQGFVDVHCAANATCVALDDGAIFCAGSPFLMVNNLFPGGALVDISHEEMLGCGLTKGGVASCWGTADAERIAEQLARGEWVDLTVGRAHACVLDDAGEIFCEGRNNAGQTDAPAEVFVDVSAAGDRTCGLTPAGELICWGHTP